MTVLKSIDLFAGAGGLSYGLTREGCQILAALEVDPISAKSYRLNHKDTEIIVNDIRKVDNTEVLSKAGIAPGELDILTGCPPCQAFSTLRTHRKNKKSSDTSESLIIEMLRFVRSTQPRAVVLENVPGLVKNKYFVDFQRGLDEAGYQYAYAILNAAHFGVPQRRKRLILIALQGRNIPLNWFSYECKHKTVRDAIENLAPAGASGDVLHDLPEKRTAAMMERIKATPKDGGSRLDIPDEFQCKCHKNIDGFKDVYGRMAWDNVSPTITSGCNNPSRGRFLHPQEDRAITLREAALLQTFPETYQFCLDRGKEHVAAQIGNAFPPDMIRPIAKVIRKELLDE